MRLRVLDTGLAPARWNVAMSAALLESVDAGAPATLRLHCYSPSCVIGRNQDVDAELDMSACVRGGIEIARRTTGGGAVVMGPGILAFDLVVPVAGRDALVLPRQAGEAVVQVLRNLDLDAVLATPGSITVGELKVSGSAGRLGRRAALHQATLILDLAEAPPLSLLRRRTEGGRPTADPRHRVAGLSHLRLPHEDGTTWRGRMDAHLVSAISTAFRLEAEPASPFATELARGNELLARMFGRDDFVFDGDVDQRRAA